MTPDELEALTHRPEPGPHRTTIEIDGVPTTRSPTCRRPRPAAVRRPQPVAGQRRGRPLPPGPARPAVLAPADARRHPPAGTPVETADDALVAAGHGITDLIKAPSRATRRATQDLREGVGPLWQKIALWRPAAVVFIYKRAAQIAAGRDLRRAVGSPRGRRPRRPTLLPDAGPLRHDRAGRRGPQPAAEPGDVAAGRSPVVRRRRPARYQRSGGRQSEHERRR